MNKKVIFRFFHFLLMLIISLALITGCGSENGNDKADKEATYYCPMHPEVTSDKPGVCPICHMDLVLKENDAAMEEHLDGAVSMNDNKLLLANISTVKVVKENLNKIISSYSSLDFAEQNRKLVTARFSGRIEKLFVDKTGDYVKQGEPLFEIYSPDLVQAQNEYLIAAGSKDKIKSIPSAENRENTLLKSARNKLLLLGFTNEQIEELEKSGEVKMTASFYSPLSGTVIEKKVVEGMYINEGTVIYDIADLSTLWNLSEIYEEDLGHIKEGSKITLSINSFPGETFEGRVSLIYPVVNPQTRTIKVRSVVQNRNNKLKPNMYGEAKFEVNLGKSLIVPEDAILFTGERKLVYVQIDKGKFQPREIETGFKVDNKYQVLSGLTEGEEIAATGAYLIDSESRLRSGTSTTHQHNDVEVKEKKEADHSQHSSDEMKKPKQEADLIHERDVKVSILDKNKDGFVFQCPMDWEVISDIQGSCPLCKMDLEKFSIDEAQKNLIEYP